MKQINIPTERGLLRAALLFTVIGIALLAPVFMRGTEINERVASVNEAWKRANEIRKTCPWPGAYVRDVQGTQSMWPVIDEGCILVVADKPYNSIVDGKDGDICSANRVDKDGNRLPGVLHRAVAHYGKGDTRKLILSGDNNRRSDGGAWGDKEVSGVVYAIIRFKDVPWSPSMSLAAWQAKVSAKSNLTATTK